MYLSVHPISTQIAESCGFFFQIALTFFKFNLIMETHKNIIYRQTDLDHPFAFKIIVSHAINR